MKKCYFAGGCFWCISGPFYTLDGVLKVESGFSGGDEDNPKYLDVKGGLTHHRETIAITYDEKVISLDKLVDVYLMNVDPFDGEGQFIDRGESYTLALFYQDEIERKLYLEKIAKLSKETSKKVYIDVLLFKKFFLAEDEHQDFPIKHKKEYLNELIVSGRRKK